MFVLSSSPMRYSSYLSAVVQYSLFVLPNEQTILIMLRWGLVRIWLWLPFHFIPVKSVLQLAEDRVVTCNTGMFYLVFD